MHLVEEKIGVTVVDEEDELVLDFCRLAGGAVGEPPVLFAEAIFQKEASSKSKSKGLNFSDKYPQNHDQK
jgi:hypothetical protein